jgi:transcription-repair coupling factor (superfamily II helicase)
MIAHSDCAVGVAAVRIAEALVRRNVLAIVSGDYRAQDIHAALLGAAPKAEIIFFSPSDALPGDAQPPTAANTGVRLASLRRARGLMRAGARQVACVTTAEAASEMLPKPDTLDGPLTRLGVGGRIDADSFRTVICDIGYFEDDRVDEPAEFALRGKVIDIFPANADRPARIEVTNGVIQHIREYDPVSQRSHGDLPFIDIGTAAWPAFLGRSNPLFDYFPGAVIALDPGAAAERARFLSLAADATHGARKKAVSNPNVVAQTLWDGAMKKRTTIDLAASVDQQVIRFSANSDPVRAMNAEIGAAV